MKTTDFKRKFKNSGELTLYNDASIASNSLYVFSLDERFIPYNYASVTNLSSQDATIIINNNHRTPLPTGTTSIVSTKNIRDLRILNQGSSSISSDEIILIYSNDGYKGKEIVNNIRGGFEVVSNAIMISNLRKFF